MPERDKARYPLGAPRPWHGMTTGIWLRLLARNRFSISPTRIPMALSITAVSGLNVVARVVEDVLYGRRTASTAVPPPLFIIGHWRTGTTLLHELLVRDERFGYASMYDCMTPHHFVHTGWYLAGCLGWLLPDRRPMDDMPLGLDRPQEDEFALCNLGIPSPYLSWAFPNRFRYERYLDLLELPEAEREAWKRAFLWYLRRLTIKDPRRLVLKSPVHTARIKTLLELFPEAQFVHAVRDPFEVVPSTVLLWQRMSDVLGLNTQLDERLEEYLFSLSARMHRRFEQDRRLLDPGQICDVRFEELVADPVGTLERVYGQLRLGDFERVREKLQEYVRSSQGYRPNRHVLSADLRQRIAARWADYIQRYGYAAASPAKVPVQAKTSPAPAPARSAPV